MHVVFLALATNGFSYFCRVDDDFNFIFYFFQFIFSVHHDYFSLFYQVFFSNSFFQIHFFPINIFLLFPAPFTFISESEER